MGTGRAPPSAVHRQGSTEQSSSAAPFLVETANRSASVITDQCSLGALIGETNVLNAFVRADPQRVRELPGPGAADPVRHLPEQQGRRRAGRQGGGRRGGGGREEGGRHSRAGRRHDQQGRQPGVDCGLCTQGLLVPAGWEEVVVVVSGSLKS